MTLRMAGFLSGGLLFLLPLVCAAAGSGEVVIYTSVDQVFSEPVLRTFEKQTGIRVRALYDVEAAKTVGLVNRLIAEAKNPKADVFWSSEAGRTVQLARKGVLAPYRSPQMNGLPEALSDPGYLWTGFSARARVLIVNTGLVKDLPKSITDLSDPAWRGRFTLAYPLFGTTATHVAALYVTWGAAKTESYLKSLVENKVIVVDGNAMTRDLVVDGKAAVGFTDTDDAYVAIAKGKPVRMVYPDQEGIGTLLIPNTVALVKNGPNAGKGKLLIDYLLSEEAESRLAFGEAGQMPLRKGVRKPPTVPDIASFRFMNVNYGDIADKLDQASRFCKELFIR